MFTRNEHDIKVNDESNMLFQLRVHDPNALELFEACGKLLERFGEMELVDETPEVSKNLPDGYLTINAPSGSTSQYVCEAKRRIDLNALTPITERLRERASALAMKPLLIASHVNESLGKQLRKEKIAYLDAVGNACLVTDPLVYIWLQGFKPIQKPERVSRAFQTTGLQLIALLLSRKNAVEQPYRELAEEAGLSLGSTSRILSDLRTLGFVRLISPGRNSLVNCRRLLEHWEFGYSTRLRPRMTPQTYKQADKLPVDELPEQIPKDMREDVLVGGELAAALITRNLRPEGATFHLRPNRPILPIIKEMKLIPDKRGNIVLLEQFGQLCAWRWKNHEQANLVNPLLVYAELLQGNPDDRLRETAKLILDQHLAPILSDEP
jgi:hypothetical protein